MSDSTKCYCVVFCPESHRFTLSEVHYGPDAAQPGNQVSASFAHQEETSQHQRSVPGLILLLS